MIRAFDYKCSECSRWYEQFFDSDEAVPDRVLCPNCGQVALQKWRKAPGMAVDGGEYFSAQLGMRFPSRQAFKAHVKSIGCELASPEELHRTESTYVPDKTEEKASDAKILEAMEESWQRTVIGRQKVAPLATIDIDREDE